jgi:hypothetical protein
MMNRAHLAPRLLILAATLFVALVSSSCQSGAGVGVGVGTPARWGSGSGGDGPPIFVGGPSY